MELREWLIILGLALVTLIVVDGIRRLKRQRRVPRLDQVGENNNHGSDDATASTEADTNWELPNGGARVISPASYAQAQSKPKPKLKRQEHPGPSRVLAGLKAARHAPERPEPSPSASPPPRDDAPATRAEPSFDATSAGDAAPASSDPPRRETASTREQPERTPIASTEPTLGEHARKDAKAPSESSVQPTMHSRESTPAEHESAPAEHQPAAATASTTSPRPDDAKADVPRREPTLSALDDAESPSAMTAEPLAADPGDHEELHDDDERYRLVDLEGMSDSIKSGSRRMGHSVQRFGASMQQRLAKRREEKRLEKARREKARAEKAALDAQRRREAEAEKAARDAERRRLEAQVIEMADDDDPLFAPPRTRQAEARDDVAFEPMLSDAEQASAIEPDAGMYDDDLIDDDVVRAHPTLAKALRHDVNAERARETLSHSDEVIVISVLSRDEQGFSGEALLDLMLACGLRYSSEMGIFHRFETEDPESELQFSMVNVIKPGTFPIEAMDEFRTPGVTLLMPLPGALDTAAAFEAMVETAMVIVRNLGGELKDENHSVMTAQTVEFARQRVQEFERRNRLNRYQVN
ncbi:cell division protein ZipA [Billgrantia montanilacus]|uniref:Cell division protein ZipA n=1 Tax=Billgrantia montanilacus TaxID=2282305 RepID=A0A368U0J5_9GAMM|nr:cell division protein ZipA [Halomonas montanilacus]RCV90017.1 cell division protein ZipA [Halomonas montanilacus]